MNYNTKKTITEYSGEFRITTEMLIKWARDQEVLPKDVPDCAVEIALRVPSGGDYSGCRLNTDEEELIISWKYSKENEAESNGGFL